MAAVLQRVGIPDAIGVGCRRCASSWLHSVLNQHPMVGKPKDGIHYFSEKYDLGDEWYLSNFASMDDKQKLIEFSVSYAYPECCGSVAERIARLNPGAKLFAVVRNPVDRAFSDYLRSTRMLEISSSTPFNEALQAHPELFRRSMYGLVFEPFYDHFPAEQIHILLYEDIERDAAAALATLFDFLGIPPHIDQLRFDRKGAQGGVVRHPILNHVLFAAKKGIDGILGMMLPGPWRKFKSANVRHYSRIVNSNVRTATVSMDTRRTLFDTLQSDIEKFSSLINRDLTQWT